MDETRFTGIVAIGSFVLGMLVMTAFFYGSLIPNYYTSNSEFVEQGSFQNECRIPLPVTSGDENKIIGYIYWVDPYLSPAPWEHYRGLNNE